jgi:FMN hydrolase / 5-amino-6-(5-phospho-D-ribitylamino)uracil phosphatase
VTLASKIKVLTVDLDDTLWPCMPTIMHAENTSYAWLQQHRPKITQSYTIDGLRDKRKQLMSQRPELMNDLSEARRAHFRQLSDETGYDYQWIEEGFKVFHDARQKVTFYEDVLPALEKLKQKFTLVALTNGNAVIDKVGLGDYFELQISAADVSAAKPNPAMFIEAIKRIGVSAGGFLHIGDHANHDIYGARNAGIRSVWVNRKKEVWPEEGFSADFEVNDLSGVVELLGL